MASQQSILGSVKIPPRLAPLFLDPEIPRVLSEARTLVSKAPQPWEIVEVPSEGGIELHDVPFTSVPVELSEEAMKRGRKQMEEAYSNIEKALKQLDRRIRELERTALRRLLNALGFLLVLTAIILLVIGVFRDSHVALTGKDGAAGLLLGTGLSLLGSLYAKDRNLRTLTSRIRARLGICRSHSEYAAALECFTRTLEQLEMEFSRIGKSAAKSVTA